MKLLFHLAGFEWDYEGTIVDCGEGKLHYLGMDSGGAEELSPRSLLLRLKPEYETAELLYHDELDKLRGDRIFLSSDPGMQLLNPKVHEIIVYFTENNVD
ncbi:hypothetical protein MASR1M36_13650 [Candidatus Cloacimonadaceae bacterium]